MKTENSGIKRFKMHEINQNKVCSLVGIKKNVKCIFN